MASSRTDVVVLGAGIVGVGAALHLQAKGRAVTLVDRVATVASETSFGNSGIVQSEAVFPYMFPRAPGEIARERGDEHRWYVEMRVIFAAPDDGLIWAAEYEHGLTEIQEDHDPWDGQQWVTLTRYESYEKTVTAWREVGA